MMERKAPKPSHEVEAELKAMLEESAALKIEIAELESTLEAKKLRQNQLHGSPWNRSGGEIACKKSELEDAKRYETDSTKPVVVWKVEDRYGDKGERIVSRVTPKRIYIRKRGEAREEIYNRDGTHSYNRTIIDVKATLGESAVIA